MLIKYVTDITPSSEMTWFYAWFIWFLLLNSNHDFYCLFESWL